MEPILIKRNTKDVKYKLDFLIKQELSFTFAPHKKFAFFLVGFTLFTFLLFFTPETEFFNTIKGFAVFFNLLLGVIGLFFLLIFLIRKNNRIKWRNLSVDYYKDHDETALMSFDNEKICLTTKMTKIEVNWGYYSTYHLDKDSIFIFPNYNIYEALYFSKN